jgi:hypothetical protein
MLILARAIRAIVLIVVCAAIRTAFADVVTLAKDTVILLQRGACERRCAVYKVIILGDGTTIFDGQYFVRRDGVVRAQVSAESIERLLTHAERAGFFEMPNVYNPAKDGTCAKAENDAPIVVLTISAKGRARTVVHYQSCPSSGPDRLTAIENEIDEIAGVHRWIR